MLSKQYAGKYANTKNKFSIFYGSAPATINQFTNKIQAWDNGKLQTFNINSDTRKTLAQNPKASELFQAQARNAMPLDKFYSPENIKNRNVVPSDITDLKKAWVRWDADLTGTQQLGSSAEDIIGWRNKVYGVQKINKEVNETRKDIFTNIIKKQQVIMNMKKLISGVPDFMKGGLKW
jgi:hypothetical protein